VALATGLALGLALAIFLVPTLWGRPWSIDHFYDRVFFEFALARPMLLSQLRVLEPWGIRFHNDDLDDFSTAFQLEEAERVRRDLATLRSYDVDAQTVDQRLSTQVLGWFLEVLADGEPYLLHDFPLNQFSGVQNELPDFMLNVHQIHDARDARDYVTRLSRFGTAADQVIAGMQERATRGIVPPRVILERVAADLDRFVAGGPDANPLDVEFEKRLGTIAGLPERERDELLAAARAEIRDTVFPAWQRLAHLVPELEAQAPVEVGAWNLPDGALYYGWALRFHTTTNLDADAIHELGLREVARIQAEMREILEAEGHPVADVTTEAIAAPAPFEAAPLPQAEGPAGTAPAVEEAGPGTGAGSAGPAAAAARVPSLGDVLRDLHHDERFLYPDTDEGRAAILADDQRILDEVAARLPSLFGRLPRAPVQVERVPPFKEAGAAGAYYMPPPLDGSKPGIFYLNLRNPRDVVRFGMRTLVFHEAIPGHHLQIALAQEQTGLPLFRRVLPFTAFVEGWALYAETLAAEQGWHPTPMDRLGQLVAEVFRAARLVVDTGIHARRWTREQAIDYMLRNTGMPEGDVAAEVERYIVTPGQACAYKVGQMKILELRERARERLGPRFDLREFHDRVLGQGALPLVLLEEEIDRWLASK
jgi:uncharacterized protein (DUF885 family)